MDCCSIVGSSVGIPLTVAWRTVGRPLLLEHFPERKLTSLIAVRTVIRWLSTRRVFTLSRWCHPSEFHPWVLLSGAKACKCLPTAVRFALIHFFSRKDISSSQSYMSYVGHRWNEKAEKIMCCGLLLELKELGFTLGHYVQASQPFWVNSSWL